jgi:aspartyl-tRNA(Asn)/glutamyl-tRNA(Gln) amidotransferase subunit A
MQWTVAELAHEIRTGHVTARDAVEHALAAVERTNGLLNAFVHLDPDGARAAAAAVDATPPDERGPLAGVPFGVKDLEHCAGMPTTFGSRWHLADGPVAIDDLHVARLRRAGAIPIGKTATPEFGAWAYTQSPALGVTRNPWNPDRTPGGSSGGSAAAVSAGMVPFCTASDGGGSIRIPAAMTGLVGLKPNYGRIPTLGVTRLAQNAVLGALSTTVRDQALLLDVMAGPDLRDRTCLPAPTDRYTDLVETLDVAGLRAAWTPDLGFAVVDPEYAAIAERAASELMAAARLTPVAPTIAFDDYIRTYVRVEGVDQFVDVPPELWPDRLDELDPRVRGGWESAATVTLPAFAAVEADRRRIELQTAALFDDVDVLLMPTTGLAAFAAEGPMPTEIAGRPVHGGMAAMLTMFANLMNLPAISVPAGLTADGLPVGVQVVAARFREDRCLRLARIAELTIPWPRLASMADGSER